MIARRKRLVTAVAATLLGGAFIYGKFQRDIVEARARATAGGTVVQTRCGPIEYEEAGHGIPVLVVHGAGGGHDQGMTFARPLVQRGFRVIAVSRFGYLGTPLPADASAQAQADAHACLLDALAVPQAAIIGVSAGGPSSVQFAIRHPDRALRWCCSCRWPGDLQMRQVRQPSAPHCNRTFSLGSWVRTSPSGRPLSWRAFAR